MELLIKACPACGAVVMGDEPVCSGCGKELPAASEARQPANERSATSETACPRCGMKVPRGVLRCRDCGTYMNPEVEAAALAQQAGRVFATGGSSGGLTGGGMGFGSTGYNRAGSPASSSFAEVADDADFDLVPEVDLVDVNMRDIDEGRMRRESQHSADSLEEDDFELGDGSGAVDYEVATDSDTAAAALPQTPRPRRAHRPQPQQRRRRKALRRHFPQSHTRWKRGEMSCSMPPSRSSRKPQNARSSDVAACAARRSTAATADRFLVFCPNGHRVQVQERHRGRTGRCPNCKALFFVPLAETNQTLGQAGGQIGGATAGESAGQSPGAAAVPAGYSKWITDVRLHRVNPAKLKLKPGSLEADYEAVDLGVSSEHLLVAVVYSGSGPFRAMQEPKKKAATRQAMLEYLAANKPLAELPVPRKYPLTPELLTQLKIVQPSIPGEESLFADVPVFGKGRIAVRVPAADVTGERAYLSFNLSQFRQLSQILSESFGLADYGTGTSIPLTDAVDRSHLPLQRHGDAPRWLPCSSITTGPTRRSSWSCSAGAAKSAVWSSAKTAARRKRSAARPTPASPRRSARSASPNSGISPCTAPRHPREGDPGLRFSRSIAGEFSVAAAPIPAIARSTASGVAARCGSSVTIFPCRRTTTRCDRSEQFGQVRRDQQHGGPLGRQFPDQIVDLALGPHVDAARRFVDQQNPAIGGQTAGENDLLLVALPRGPATGVSAGGCANRQLAAEAGRRAPSPPGDRRFPASGETVENRQRQVLADVHRPAPVPAACDLRESASDPARCAASRRSDATPACRRRIVSPCAPVIEPEDRFEHFRSPGADQPRQPDDFAGPQFN